MSRRKRIFLSSIVALVCVAIGVVTAFLPEGGSRNSTRRFGTVDAPVGVRMTLDTLDAARGVLRVRIDIGSQNLPPEGATVFTNMPGLASTSLPVDSVAADHVSEVLVDAGDIADYPYDAYSHAFQFLAVPGRDAPLPTAAPAHVLPITIEVVNALPGFTGTPASSDHDGVTTITTDVHRRPASVVWATAMIGIYWLLAISAFAVMLATVLGLRTFETRHLAWLVGMIFAFSAFRGTAPGSPPIGVFLDFASFFWAEAIVAFSLIALVTFYLTGDRGAPPSPDPTNEAEGGAAPDARFAATMDPVDRAGS